MAEIIPDGQLIPLDLSFVKGAAFCRSLTAADVREIEKGFPHYSAAAGPSRAGAIQDDQLDAYHDELIAQAVVDEAGQRLFHDRGAVASLNIRRHNEAKRKVFAALNGTEQDAEIESLRGLWNLAADYLRDDQHGPAVALDFWTAAKTYVEGARKNVRSAGVMCSPAS